MRHPEDYPTALDIGLLDAIESATCVVDASGRVLAVNAAWRGVDDASEGNAAAGHPSNRADDDGNYLAACDATPDDAPDVLTARTVAAGLRDVLSGRTDRFQTEYPCHDDTERRWFSVRITPTQAAGERGAVITHVDVTALQEAHNRLAEQTLHDALTGLPNRMLLLDRLRQALQDGERRAASTAVAFLDLDQFKDLCEQLGPRIGDILICQVAARLQAQIRPGDTLAHFAVDEFVVIWRDLHDAAEAALLGQRLAQAFAAPFKVGPDQDSVSLTATIGIAVGRGTQTSEGLLLTADAAMCDAKLHNRGGFRLSSAELQRNASEHLATEAGLRDALTAGQLVVHYQPVIDLVTGRPVVLEALVRWQHPERGLLAPDQFLPLARSTGLIVPLNAWVLHQACQEAASWTGPLAELGVSVNVSAHELTRQEMLAMLGTSLADSGLNPRRLQIEITEAALMENVEAAGSFLLGVARLGVRVAIDDFGTGFSSLPFLRQHPIAALKIDRTFVAGLGSSADDEAVCASIVNLAHTVGAISIAEGVETPEQYAALTALGCQQAQGYLWSSPVPPLELPQALQRCAQVTLPSLIPAPRNRRRSRAAELDPAVQQRIFALQRAGASMHTIAAALNADGVLSPAGVRWHAFAVGRYVAAGASSPSPVTPVGATP